MARKKSAVKEKNTKAKTSKKEVVEVPEMEIAGTEEVKNPQTGREVPLTGKAKDMKSKLEKEDKVSIFMPLSSGEKKGAYQSVILNGYPLYIRKGEQVKVPESVAKILETKIQQSYAAQEHPNRLGGDGTVHLTNYGG